MTALDTAPGEAGPGGTAGPGSEADPDDVLAPSTTARSLRRLRRALVAGSLLLGLLCIVEFDEAHSALQQIDRTDAPAVIQVREASDALADAEQAALKAVSAASALGGVGDEYDNDIALVDQSLTELGGDNAAGAAGLTQIKLVEATMVTYNNQVEQAYADYESRAGKALDGYAQGPDGLDYPDLAQATNLAATVQSELDTLTGQENAALTAQRSSAWLEAVADLPWLLLGLAVAALFAGTLRLIRTRFRRRFSVPLLLGAACAIAVPVLCGSVVWTGEQDAGRALDGPYATTVHIYDQLADTAENGAVSDQRALTPQSCPNVNLAGLCGDGLPASSATPAAAAGDAAPSTDALQELSTETQDFDAGLAAATANFGPFVILLAVLAALGAVLAALGLYHRIAEYTFRD